jgi:hypothetical protein
MLEWRHPDTARRSIVLCGLRRHVALNAPLVVGEHPGLAVPPVGIVVEQHGDRRLVPTQVRAP